MSDDEDEDEFVNALLDELSTLRTRVSISPALALRQRLELTCGQRTQLYESQLNAELVESHVRAQITKEYEQKMLDMERRFQERLREEVRRFVVDSSLFRADGFRAQAIEAENKLNAKLDILTRLQAAKTPGRGATRKVSLTPSTAYDDSDDGEGIEEEGEEEEEEVEKMLLSASRGAETSFAESSVRTSPSF